MKKYWVGILLLAGMLGGILLHIRHLEAMIGELTGQVDQAQTYAECGDFSAAESQVSQALNAWEQAGHYTHIFIRHTEIDSTTDAFCDLIGALAGEDAGESRGAFRKLHTHLHNIAQMERVSIGSIF